MSDLSCRSRKQQKIKGLEREIERLNQENSTYRQRLEDLERLLNQKNEQVRQTQNYLRRLEQEKKLWQAEKEEYKRRIKLLQEEKEALRSQLEEEKKISEERDRIIQEVQRQNDIIRAEMAIRVREQLAEQMDRMLRILPEISSLAGREPQKIIGLNADHVLNHLVEELSRFFGEIHPFPSDRELILSEESDGSILEIVITEENLDKVGLLYDWGNEKVCSDFKNGQRLRFRLLRRGWRTDEQVLVPAAVTLVERLDP